MKLFPCDEWVSHIVWELMNRAARREARNLSLQDAMTRLSTGAMLHSDLVEPFDGPDGLFPEQIFVLEMTVLDGSFCRTHHHYAQSKRRLAFA